MSIPTLEAISIMDTMVNFINKIKYIVVFPTVFLFGCFPSFNSENIQKETNCSNRSMQLVYRKGILDQDPYSYVIMNNPVDTICFNGIVNDITCEENILIIHIDSTLYEKNQILIDSIKHTNKSIRFSIDD